MIPKCAGRSYVLYRCTEGKHKHGNSLIDGKRHRAERSRSFCAGILFTNTAASSRLFISSPSPDVRTMSLM